MELRKEEFPVALQAYEVRGDHEDFLAEQVVGTQNEADKFMSMYAGRLISLVGFHYTIGRIGGCWFCNRVDTKYAWTDQIIMIA